jgi:PST family polysaccharide transporter
VDDNLHAEEAVEAEGIMGADGLVVVPAGDRGTGLDGGDGQSLGTKASRGFLWANVGILTRYVAALVLAAVLARSLTSDEYRVMVVLTTVLLYLDTALDLGMGAALVFEQERGITRRVRVAFTANVALSVVLAVLAVLLAPAIAWIYHLEDYVNVFRALGVVVLISGLTTVPWALFTREMAFRPRAFTEVTRDLSRFLVTLLLVAVGWGAWGVLVGFLVAKVVWWLLTWWRVKFRPGFAWDRTIFGELFSYAWKHAGNSFLGLLALNGDYFVVGRRASSELGTYYQAFRLPEFFLAGQLNAMSAVLFPMYSRIRSDGPAALRNAMYKALSIVSMFSIPAGIGLALVARDAFGLMFGTYNPAGITTMEIISITGCVVGLGFATGDLLFATGRPGVMMKLNLVMVPMMLGAMWLVGPKGIVWIAGVHLLTATVFTTIRQVIVNRVIGASMLSALRAIVPGLTVGLCVGAAALPVRLMTSKGFTSMLLIVAAGVVGGAVGLALSSTARSVIRELIAKLRGD